MRLQRAILLGAFLAHASPALATWPGNGVAITSPLGSRPRITADLNGGALIAWHDESFRVWVRRVASDGTLVQGFPVRLVTTSSLQMNPVIAPDGQGGAYVAWQQTAAPPNNDWDIVASHVAANGTLDWPSSGVVLVARSYQQILPDMIADGNGGAIVVWQDDVHNAIPVGSNYDIYAQRLDRNDPDYVAWTLGGKAISGDGSRAHQKVPTLVTDKAGGAIIVWEDERNGLSDIYARKISAAGSLGPEIPVSTAPEEQKEPVIAADGSGGAIVAWRDSRNGAGFAPDIYARHILSTGALDWESAVCALPQGQVHPAIVSTDDGGAIISWQDLRSGTNYDIFSLRITPRGVPHEQWLPEGNIICSATDGQYVPRMISDGASGALVTWYDNRTGENDVYLQRVGSNGSLARDWSVTGGLALCSATNIQKDPVLVRGMDGGVLVAWEDLRSGSTAVYAQHAIPVIVAGVDPAIHAARIDLARPNPFRLATTIHLALSEQTPVTIEVFDILGRKVKTLARRTLDPGEYSFRWDGASDHGGSAAPGLYFLRTVAGERVRSQKVVRIQ